MTTESSTKESLCSSCIHNEGTHCKAGKRRLFNKEQIDCPVWKPNKPLVKVYSSDQYYGKFWPI